MKSSDKQNIRLEQDEVLGRATTDLLPDHTDLYKLFADNESFRRGLTDRLFQLTYGGGNAA